LAEIEVPVHPVEVEQIGQGFAHTNVRKEGLSRVEDEAVHALGQQGRHGLPDDAAVPDRRNVVARRPLSGIALDPEVIKSCLKGFEQAVGIAIEIVADLVEVIEAAGDRQILSPIILAALQHDAFTRPHLGQGVGAGADRRSERGLVEGLGIRGMGRKDRHRSDDQRQFPVVGSCQVEPDAVRIENLDGLDLPEARAVKRLAVFLQHLE
jgi:hypothetical protein